MKAYKFLCLILLCTFIAGCSSSDDELAYEEKTVEDLYNEAQDAFAQESYRQAAQLYDEVERQHPYSAWAKQAQIMAAFSYYQSRKYDDAVATLDRFIRLHPGHKDIDYAYYLRAISFYEQISDVRRDQGFTKLAQDSLNEVMVRFPSSKYARDAKLKYDLTRDHLAGKEMAIGRYYQRVDNHLAAINRFKAVVDDYETTTHVQEALYRLIESYVSLGLIPQAKQTAAVLGHNYPGGKWYEKSYDLLVDEKGRVDPKSAHEKGFFEESLDYVIN